MEPFYLFFLIESSLLLLLAFLSGSETAILSSNRLRAKHQMDLGSRGAKAVIELHARKEDFLPSILAAETLLTVAMSTFGTNFFAKYHSGTGSLIVSAIAITLIVLILGEIFPKTVAARSPDRLSYSVAPTILFLIKFLSIFLRPITWGLYKSLKLFGSDLASSVPTETELKYLISLSREHGVVEKEEEELLQNIFEFTDSKVGEVMIPRTQVVSLEADATLQEVLEKFATTRFSRFPVHAKDLDHVLGFLDIRDILGALAMGEKHLDLKAFIRPAHFVPESKKVGKLLNEMRKEHLHLAIVIDEYGGTAGLVSLTNLVEEIVGNLEEKISPDELHPTDGKSAIVPASTKLDEIEAKFGISFNTEEYQTLGGLVFGLFGRVPEQGEQIRHQNLKFTITEKDGYKINKIMVTKEIE